MAQILNMNITTFKSNILRFKLKENIETAYGGNENCEFCLRKKEADKTLEVNGIINNAQKADEQGRNSRRSVGFVTLANYLLLIRRVGSG